MPRGLFISFEGVEGCGKTTQASALVDWFRGHGVPTVYVRDPGGTDVGEAIRTILLDPRYDAMRAKTEVLLFLASRSQLTYEKIMPALNKKQVVVTDRFADSTMVYQAYARNLPERLIAIFNRFATAGLKPDITFLVDIDISKGRKRGVFNDRMEQENMDYHQRVRDGFLRLARKAKKRIIILDGEKTIETLNDEVITCVKKVMVRKGYNV
jgi:dTMP kinase